MKKFAALVLAMLMLMSFACAQAMTAGTYEAAATGFHGDIKIAVTVDENAITAIEVLEQSETEGIGTPAIEKLPAKFVGCKTADDVNGVDAIGGATVTSKALKAAVIDCLTQSMGN